MEMIAMHVMQAGKVMGLNELATLISLHVGSLS
jgi:hypothetical protein